MTPIQQLYLGVGAKKKTYLDDVFSTYAYPGEADAYSTQTIVNNIDLATEGGMVWIKNRNSAQRSIIGGSVIGDNKYISSSENDAVATNDSRFKELTTTGFKVGGNNKTGLAGENYVSWSFRKAPGFFDIVTYTGNGANARAISHSLGSVPGMVIVKALNDSSPWTVYHKEIGPTKYLYLNDTQAAATDEWWGEGAATFTASNFYVQSTRTNANNTTFVAYVFAGGESTAATARSVDFDGSGDYLVVYNQADLSPEDGDFTCEMWIKPDSWSTGDSLVYASSSGFSITRDGSNNALKVGMAGSTTHLTSTSLPEVGQWTHIAVARSGTTMRLFFNGVLNKTETVSHNYASPVTMYIVGGGGEFNGKISNFRFVKGTAVYTSSFRPPTEPLANITNTKLLCCNGSSTNSSTVTPGTLNAEGDPTASTDSPFDDPAGFVFGESGSENVIKCGSYKGSGSAGLEVNVGWEPSWLMIKATSRTGDWYIMDSIRGVVTSGNDEYVKANGSDAEGSADVIEFTSTGFKVISTGTHWNNSAETYSFTAIRRSDGYCGKPPALGTGVFAMDTGAGSSTIPNFDSGFPVDWAITRAPANFANWEAGGRLIQGKWLETNNTNAESSGSYFTFDSNTGWMSGATAYNSSYQSWMWKRHAGFDVVCWDGNSNANRVLNHSMNASPEMIWYKRRDATDYWGVGVNFTNSNFTFLQLNDTAAGSSISYTARFKSKPTSTSFEIGADSNINGTGGEYIAMLFASTDVSKVGSYTGNGGNQTITFGFQPRFVIIKSTAANTGWVVLDTIRGWTDSDSRLIRLDRNNAQDGSDSGIGYTTSTGMVLTGAGSSHTNENNVNFIYYAHA